MSKFRDLILGIGRNPQAVALARSVAYLVVPGLGDLALAYLAHPDPRLYAVAPVLAMLVRAAEGAFDQRMKPSQNLPAAPVIVPPAQVPVVPK